MTTIKIAPSILAADFTRLGEHVREAEAGGAELLHLDVMDGQFVPNISFGPMVVEAVRRVTKLPLDVHLMIEKPERYLDVFAKAGATMMNVHVETCPHLHRTIQQIKALNVKAGVAINPHTPFEMIREILGDVDRVLVMTVNPGFGGQKLIHSTLPKVRQISEAIKQYKHEIEVGVDGGIDAQTIAEVRGYGADVFIAGSSVFGYAGGVAAGIKALREKAGK
ncbi:MAG: ribulose-phosphate 3-epimerase [Anaerolineae bacterium]|nr:ribulose-phosphate 3-epimerase [Anaerolineae bacterium]